MEFRKFFKARVFKYVFKDSNLVAPHFCREDYRGEAISIGSLMMSVKCIIPLRAPLNPRPANHLECINTYIYIFMCYISSRRLATMLPFYCAIARSSRHCERKWGIWGAESGLMGFMVLANLSCSCRHSKRFPAQAERWRSTNWIANVSGRQWEGGVVGKGVGGAGTRAEARPSEATIEWLTGGERWFLMHTLKQVETMFKWKNFLNEE